MDRVLAGRAWLRGRLQPIEVGLSDDGWIVEVARSIRSPNRTDLGEAVLLPSAVDLHVHFRDPGGPDAAETIATGTLQAALGGVGLVGDMPNTEPPVRTTDDLEGKAARLRGQAACDVVLYALAESRLQVGRVGARAGALKLYTAPTTGVERPADPSEWPAILTEARRFDLPVTVHAEDPRRFARSGTEPRDLPGWDAARPIAAERAAVAALLAVAGTARVHVAHVTEAGTASAVRAAGFSHEVTPHHLLLSSARHGLGSLGKVNPPLRDEPTRAALWAAFRTGAVPIVASDHAPHAGPTKEREFAKCPSGAPGVGTLLPLLLAQVARGELALPVLQAAAADRPARWFGVPMGRLAPGHRARLLAIDFRERTRLREGPTAGSESPTPFAGFEAVFPRVHYFDGEPIVEDGEYVGRRQGRERRPEFVRGGPGRPPPDG